MVVPPRKCRKRTRARLATTKARLDLLDPSATLKLDGELLARYPEGYCHLAYALVRAGRKVRTDMPGLDGPALDAVYARGAAWLAGKPLQIDA